MEELRNYYELRKTIRFTLEPKDIQRPYQEPENPDDTGVESFIALYIQLIDDIESLFYHNKEEQAFQKKVSIKKDWIKTYCKQAYHDNTSSFKNSNKISLGTTDFLKDFFKRWFEENRECCNTLTEAIQQPAERKQRRSKYAYYIRKIGTRNNFEYMHELFKRSITHKDSDKTINNIKQRLDECSVLLKSVEQKMLPSQSLGVEIERASLNYYTLNKKIQDYAQKLEIAKSKYSKPVSILNCALPSCVQKFLDDYIRRILVNNKNNGYRTDSLHISDSTEKKNIKNDMDDIIREIYDKYKQNIPWKDLTIDLAYRFLKTYKAMQRLQFHELIAQDKDYNTVMQQYPLFSCTEENFNKIKRLTEQIQKTTNKEQLKELKEKRGKHFNIREGGSSFTDYKKVCKAFQEIAKNLGNIKAEEKAIEQEKIDAERLQSWAVLLEKDNQKYVLTIPRAGKNNLTDAKKDIDRLPVDPNGDWHLYYFESLTLQSLSKLCFGLDKNTFIPPIQHELEQHKDFIDDQRNPQKKRLKRKDQFSDDGKELIRFYQAVLGLQKTGGTLSIRYFKDLENNVIQKEFQSLDDFEKALKKSCYYKQSIAISDATREHIIKRYNGNFYKITSYDLEKEDKEVLASLERKKQLDRCHPEYHTHIWLDFWTDENKARQYDCRLNPEIKIHFVKNQRERFTENVRGTVRKSRLDHDRYLLSTTITLNANERSSNWSFKNSVEIENGIKTYNETFNKKIDQKTIWYYGLDRGQDELLTLGLFQFSPGDNGTVKPRFIDLDLYKIKEEKYLEKNKQGNIAYKSSNQFIDDSEVIEKFSKESCIDLSSAKLINGKIVVNGDISTYLKLRETAAKRKIWEGVVNGKFKSGTICFNEERQAFYLNIENRGILENEYLYFYDKRFEYILSFDTIKKRLQDHFDQQTARSFYDEETSIEKINHLKDAICANAVGIINHLQKTYPGMIVFEDLGIGNKQGRKYDDNLGSRIEWKLLRKFQSASLVPPNLQQILELQSSKKIDQLGIVLYVDTKNTSSACPSCEKTERDKSNKWSKHAYVCKHCDFNTEKKEQRKGLIALDNSDSVAAYNIAKNGFKKTVKKGNEIDK